jgi:hypothetical protein
MGKGPSTRGLRLDAYLMLKRRQMKTCYTIYLLIPALLIGNAVARQATNVLANFQTVLPIGWQAFQETGSADIDIKRAQLIDASHLLLSPVLSSPAWGEASMEYARTSGVRVWYYIRPIGTCSSNEFAWRKANNDLILAEVKPLQDRINTLPTDPRMKPGNGTWGRLPRNETEAKWIANYDGLIRRLQAVPTHHCGDDAFEVAFLCSYSGAIVTNCLDREKISYVLAAIEKVLQPYKSGQQRAAPAAAGASSGER